MLSSVTSVNIACGAHAGDLDTMHELVAAAAAAGLAIGAHPGYADRDGLGRREQHLATSEIATLVREQVNLLTSVARAHRVELRHVKPHGALYNQAATDPQIAAAIAEGVRQSSLALRLVGLAGSELIHAGGAAGLATAAEAFADRAYRRDGTLVPRTDARAVTPMLRRRWHRRCRSPSDTACSLPTDIASTSMPTRCASMATRLGSRARADGSRRAR